MRIRARVGLGFLATVLGACAADAEPEAAVASCADAQALQMPGGTCIRPGIPIDGCAAGFVHDGVDGCAPVLPDGPCPAGSMAVPGEDSCRPVLACADGKWGDVGDEPGTQHVEQAAPSSGADGSADHPWPTIGEAYAAAAPGAVIAVAEGSYVEDVLFASKPVRLRGVCPERAAIEGTGAAHAAITILAGAAGSEVRGVAVRGAGGGLYVVDATDVLVDAVWVDGPAGRGIEIESLGGPASARVVGSLVERSTELGLFVLAAAVSLEGSVVRDIAADADGWGRGISVQACPAGGACVPNRGTARIERSLVEQTRGGAIFVGSADATIEGSVVRDTEPLSVDGTNGRGIQIQRSCTVQPCEGERSSVRIVGSLIARSHDLGVAVSASEAQIESTVIDGTLPAAADGRFGRGLSIHACAFAAGCTTAVRSNVQMTTSVVRASHELGVYVSGSDLVLDRSVVRSTQARPADGIGGRGIQIQASCLSADCSQVERAQAALSSSLVDDSRDIGIVTTSSDVDLQLVMVRGNVPREADGLYGDGMAVVSERAPASARLDGVVIAESARAGLSCFGATVSMAGSEIRCAAFPLVGETFGTTGYSLEDRGGNACGCPSAAGACKLLSSGIEPPHTLDASR